MYDPTIFDNIKIVLEGSVYDRDLDHQWTILQRQDLVDLASMARTFFIQFTIRNQPAVIAGIKIKSDIHDFATEWLNVGEHKAGCFLEIQFLASVADPEICARIQQELMNIWRARPIIRQHLQFAYPNQNQRYQNEIVLHFDRKIDETNIVDIDAILDHVMISLQFLNDLQKV
jgi:hypothetical protein